MHYEEWSGTRVAAALARLGDSGYTQSRLARMAGVNRSAINRWSRAENRPGYDAVRRLAVAVWRAHPDIARELVEASGYPWQEPAELPPEPLVDPEVAEIIRHRHPGLAEEYIAHMEAREAARLSGQSGGQAASSPRRARERAG
jgi:transcriptional regulator with XRE-family HTH domain